MSDLHEQVTTELPTLLTALERSMDPALLADEEANALEPFGPGGPWRYAPVEEKEQTRRTVRDAQAQRAGEDYFRVDHRAYAFEQALMPMMEAARQPLSIEDALAAESGQRGYSRNEMTQLEILHELRRPHIEKEFKTAKPSAIRASHAALLKSPPTQDNASRLRILEGLHYPHWSGVDVGDDAKEVLEMHELHKQIEAAREARIPEPMRAVQALLSQASTLLKRAKVHGVRSQRPAGWKAA